MSIFIEELWVWNPIKKYVPRKARSCSTEATCRRGSSERLSGWCVKRRCDEMHYIIHCFRVVIFVCEIWMKMKISTLSLSKSQQSVSLWFLLVSDIENDFFTFLKSLFLKIWNWYDDWITLLNEMKFMKMKILLSLSLSDWNLSLLWSWKSQKSQICKNNSSKRHPPSLSLTLPVHAFLLSLYLSHRRSPMFLCTVVYNFK